MYTYIMVAFIAFFCESIDSSLGMGYGTLLTPILLLMGFQPLEIIPLILMSEFITGVLAALLHHRKGNVNLSIGSQASKIAIILISCSILGTIFASYVAFSINPIIIKFYISVLLLAIGFTAYITSNIIYRFSWSRVFALGLLASFNKGISGGGYGPVITGGQMLSGINSKSSIAITSLTEGFTCLIGIITFMSLKGLNIDIYLGLALLSGAVLSIPVAVNIISIIDEKRFKKYLSFVIISLGSVNLIILLRHITVAIHYSYIPIALLLLILFLKLRFHKKNIINIEQQYHLNEASEIE
ncbi:MAG: sulfite exporter TauE/SafE family protein [Halanaerobiales bacterium]